MNEVIGTMRKRSLHIIKGYFYKLTTIIVSKDTQTLKKVLIVLVLVRETKQ